VAKNSDTGPDSDDKRKSIFSLFMSGDVSSRNLVMLPDPSQFFQQDDKGSNRFVPKLLGDAILEKVNLLHFRDSDTLMIYNGDGMFLENAEQIVGHFVNIALGTEYKAQREHEVLSYIDSAIHQNIKHVNKHTDLALPTDKVNFNNGVYDFTGNTFKKHSDALTFFGKLPVNYNDTATCPTWDKFLEVNVPEETDRLTIQEFWGSCLTYTLSYQKALLLLGPTHSGKSTFTRVLKAFFGDLCSNISLYDLMFHRFQKARLYGKLINAFPQVPLEKLEDETGFLCLTGDDYISAEFKHKSPFDFRQTTKMVFASNKLPRLIHHGIEFYDRWLITEWLMQHFLGDPTTDPDMDKKLIAELSGIANWAIKGRLRLDANKKFSTLWTAEDIQDAWEKASDNVSRYCEECAKIEVGIWTLKEETHHHYVAWCKEVGETDVPSTLFHRELKKHFVGKIVEFRTNLPERPRAYKNLRIKGVDYNQIQLQLGQEPEVSPTGVATRTVQAREKVPDQTTIPEKPVESIQKEKEEPPEKTETQPPAPKLAETPLEHLERYMKREKSIGFTKVCQDLRLTPEELTILVSHSNKVAWTMAGQVLTWAPKPQGEKLEVDCICGTKTTVYPPKDELTRVVKCAKCGQENKSNKLRVRCTSPLHESPGAIYTDWFREDVPWEMQKCSICKLHGDLKVIHEEEKEKKED